MGRFNFWSRDKSAATVEQRSPPKPVQGRGQAPSTPARQGQAPSPTALPNRPVQKSAAELAMQTPQPSPAPTGAAGQDQPKRPDIKVLVKKDDIPIHASVMSVAGGPIELSAELQKNYAVLLIAKERKDVVIVCSTEINKNKADSNSIDDDYLAISAKINRLGLNRKKILANPEILAIIYESGSSSKSSEEQLRAATKIQLDFDDLLRSAVEADASDIHIEVRRDEARVRFRKNGSLYQFKPWPVRYARTMASVIYQVIADEKDTTFDDAKPQDAIIDRELSESLRLRVRLATIPAYPAGFDMIMRLLKMGQDGKRVSLDKLGYEKRHLSHIRRAVAKPVGAVIMAGTTGSGKSTSLNSMLGEKIELYEGRIKVITVEDPPEYLLIGATQVPVVRSRSQAKAGDAAVNPFASVVRAAMRSDPDILMVGEVRDEASAELLIHAVQSGHQVFTTVHASGGIDIIARLRSNGVNDDVLGGQNFISALIYQTLLQKLCPHCSYDVDELQKRVKNDQDEEFVERVHKYMHASLKKTLRFTNNDGCPKCTAGLIGRSVAAEVILPDTYMLKCFRDRRDSDALMHYRRKGGKIALEHGMLKAIRGETDLRDVELKLDQITFLEELDISVRAEFGLPLITNFQVTADIFEEHIIGAEPQQIIMPPTEIVDAQGLSLTKSAPAPALVEVKPATLPLSAPEAVLVEPEPSVAAEVSVEEPQEIPVVETEPLPVLAIELIRILQKNVFKTSPALRDLDVAVKICSKLSGDALGSGGRNESLDEQARSRIVSIYKAMTDDQKARMKLVSPEEVVGHLVPVDHAFITASSAPNSEAQKRFKSEQSASNKRNGGKPATVSTFVGRKDKGENRSSNGETDTAKSNNPLTQGDDASGGSDNNNNDSGV